MSTQCLVAPQETEMVHQGKIVLFPKQQHSILTSCARINIWEGAVRSGKTIATLVRWLYFCAWGPAGDLLITGRTQDTIYRNIITPLLEMAPDCVRYSRGARMCWIFDRPCHIVEAKDTSSEQKIRGWTLAGALVDEITILPESFFVMILSRLSVHGAQLFGTTNPDSPRHWLKVKYLDAISDPNHDRYRIRVFHFVLEDNITLDPNYVADLKKDYTGLWYQRFVLGKWVMAEGAIYGMFDKKVHVVDRFPGPFDSYYVAIDYGANHPFCALLLGVHKGIIYVIDEFYYRPDPRNNKPELTDAQFSARVKSFISGLPVKTIIVDPSALHMKVQLVSDGVGSVGEHTMRTNPNIAGAINDVLFGIQTVASEFSNQTLFIHKRCVNLLGEIEGYVWDTKAQENGIDAPVKKDDDSLDALRYGCVWIRSIPKPRQPIGLYKAL